MTAADPYTLDDLQCDTGNLCHLLRVVEEKLGNFSFGRAGNRNHGLESLSALVHLATEKAESIDRLIEEHHDSGSWKE
jgi:hypothetical protein